MTVALFTFNGQFGNFFWPNLILTNPQKYTLGVQVYRIQQQGSQITHPVMASAGMGAKLQMNTNFILSVDFGKGFDPQLSDFTVGMGTTYVF